jgi:hypothetical protein
MMQALQRLAPIVADYYALEEVSKGLHMLTRFTNVDTGAFKDTESCLQIEIMHNRLLITNCNYQS